MSYKKERAAVCRPCIGANKPKPAVKREKKRAPALDEEEEEYGRGGRRGGHAGHYHHHGRYYPRPYFGYPVYPLYAGYLPFTAGLVTGALLADDDY